MEEEMNEKIISEYMLVKAKDGDGVERVGYLTMPLGTIIDTAGSERKIDIASIRRYTGVKDKNNRMIFEGDSVAGWDEDYIGVVNWSRLFCGWRIGDRAMYNSLADNDYEVI